MAFDSLIYSFVYRGGDNERQHTIESTGQIIDSLLSISAETGSSFRHRRRAFVPNGLNPMNNRIVCYPHGIEYDMRKTDWERPPANDLESLLVLICKQQQQHKQFSYISFSFRPGRFSWEKKLDIHIRCASFLLLILLRLLKGQTVVGELQVTLVVVAAAATVCILFIYQGEGKKGLGVCLAFLPAGARSRYIPSGRHDARRRRRCYIGERRFVFHGEYCSQPWSGQQRRPPLPLGIRRSSREPVEFSVFVPRVKNQLGKVSAKNWILSTRQREIGRFFGGA